MNSLGCVADQVLRRHNAALFTCVLEAALVLDV